MPPSTRRMVLPRRAPVLLHGLEQIAGLVADGLERGLGQFGPRRAARQSEDGAARFGIPVGRAKAHEGRHEIDLLSAGRPPAGQFTGLIGCPHDLQPVAQPLHRCAGDEDRAFQRIGALAVELIGNGGQQPVLRRHGSGARVQQGEAAGAIGRLHHARLETGLADGCRLLVARHAADRYRGAQQTPDRSRRSRRHSPSPPAAGCAAHSGCGAARHPSFRV